MPVAVTGLTGVTAIAAGIYHTCAIDSSGAVKCWGLNTDGQLGNGNTTNSNVPVAVTGLTGITAIAAGYYNSCVIDSSGAVKCWGLNNYGQLGNGNTTNSKVPIAVIGLTSGVTAITVGFYSSCAMNASGAINCWGRNSVGQLGNGGGYSPGSNIPVPVSGLNSGVTAIGAGSSSSHTCAIDGSGAVKCWGSNYAGQLGDGSITTSNVPVATVMSYKTAQTITFGTAPSLVVDGTGTVSATTSSGLAATFSSTTSSVCTVNGTTVTPVATGICTIAANQVGDTTYSAAPQATQNITVGQGSQAPLTVQTATSVMTYQAMIIMSATGGSGTGAVSYSSDNSSCTIATNTLTATGTGTCNITATKAADANYRAISSAPITITINQATQSPLSVASSNNSIAYGATATMSSTGGSGTGTVSYFSDNANCTISGSTLTAAGVGTCNVTATKAADTNYTTRSSSPITITINKANQPALVATIATTSIAYGSTVTLGNFGGGGTGTVTYVSNNANCTIVGNTLTAAAIGTCDVTASKAADTNYNAINSTAITITVNKANQAALTATTSNNSIAYGGTATLGTTGGSGGGAVTYASNNANCTISGNTLTAAVVGSCVVTATKVTDTNYNAATGIVNITVTAANQAPFSASASNASPVVGSTVTLSSSGGSGTGAVTYASNNANCTISGNTLTTAVVGSCVVTATKAADANYAQTTATINLMVAAPTPPVTPTVPKDGNAGNTGNAGQELLVVGGTTITAGSSGGKVNATGSAGTSTVTVSSGSVGVSCSAAGAFCKPSQTNLMVLAGEQVTFSPDGKVTNIQINPATPSSSVGRLNGQSLFNAIIATLRADTPSLGSETGRQASDWNTVGVDFNSGKLSVAVQLPMQVNPAQPDGVQHLPNGVTQVTTQGVIANLAPTLVDADRFNTVLKTILPSAQVRTNPDGTAVVSHDHALYSFRPNLLTAGADNSGFTVDTSGNLRFGNQGIPPAAYNFDQFAAMLKDVAPTATVQVQTDGKLAVTLQGMTYILTPDYLVLASPTAGGTTGFEIRDGKLFTNYPFGFSQGFAVQ